MESGTRRTLLVLACLVLVGPGQAAFMVCIKGKTPETAGVATETVDLDGDLVIYNCPLPAVSYAAALAAHLNITALNKIKLYIADEPPLQRTHFSGLALSELTIRYTRTINSKSRCYANPDISFLDSVTSETVGLYDMILPPLPQTVLMEKVVLNNGQSLGAWGGCSNLRELRLHWWDVERVPERWLAHCSKLTSLRIHSMHQLTSQALGRALGGATSLRELRVCGSLTTIDVELTDLVNLQRLDLSWNSLRNISIAVLPASLISLDLSMNQLWSSAQVAEVLRRLPALQNLSVDWNHELDLCEESAQLEAGAHPATLQQLVLPSIVHLSAGRTATRRLCFGAMRTDSLTSLGLSGYRITVLKFRDLPVSKAPRLELNLSGNPVREVALEQADYEMLRDRRVIVTGMSESSLACYCEQDWLARAMREGRVSMEDVQLQQCHANVTRCSDVTVAAVNSRHFKPRISTLLRDLFQYPS